MLDRHTEGPREITMVARGTQPEDGKHQYLILHFSLESVGYRRRPSGQACTPANHKPITIMEKQEFLDKAGKLFDWFDKAKDKLVEEAGELKEDLAEKAKEFDAKREVLKEKLDKVRESGEEKWEELKDEMEENFTEMKAGAEKLVDKLKKTDAPPTGE